MKYLQLSALLICSICFSQKKYPDHIKVTAYRLVDEYDDGPCSILDYYKFGEIGSLVRGVESYDEKFAYKLIQLKEEAIKTWKQKDFVCIRRCIGCETVPNMFIVEINAYRDTIYTTRDNASIFIPEKQTEYLDSKHKLTSSFPKEIKELFEKEFFEEMHFLVLDSIKSEKVTIKHKVIYGMNRDTFEKNIDKFDIIETDSMRFAYNQRIDKIYHAQSNMITFNEQNQLEKLVYVKHKYHDPIVPSIDGIEAGSSEEVLFKKFPNSTRYKQYILPKYSLAELKDDYFYQIQLQEKQGWVNFYILKGIIEKIEVEFNYPESKP